jgi:hypothetical protein
MRLIFIFLILFSTNLFAKVQQKLPAYFSYGVSMSSISATDVSLAATSLNFAYRQEFSSTTKWSWSVQAIPLIRSGFSLLGIQSSANLGYKVFGSTSREESIEEKGTEVLKLKKNRTKWLGYLDAGYAVTPFFGDKTTSTYSGTVFGATLYQLGSFPLEYGLRYSKQSTGIRELSMMSFTLSLVRVF